MSKKIVIDATHTEETRVALIGDDGRLEDYDIESAARKLLKGNVFLAKVTRVEPSLQAAFVDYGGNRHGFLPFSEIHPDYYRIPIADKEAIMAEEAELRRKLEAAAEAEEDGELDPDKAAKIVAEHTREGGADSENAANNDDNKGNKGKKSSAKKEDEADNDAKAEDEDKPKKRGRPKKNAKKDTDADGEVDGNKAESEPDEADDANGNVIDDDSNDADGNKASDSDDDSDENDGNKGRRGRYRGRGRGRRGGRGGRGGRGNAPAARRSKEVRDDEDFSNPMQPLWNKIRRNYKIQEVIKRGQIMLIQINKEERGNKGAAVTSYITLPGRYCVLMPNSAQGGGVSRKINDRKERRRMRDVLKSLEVPEGMSVILRTAGLTRTKTEIKRDYTYLTRLWNSIRELTLKSSAPSLIHEEGNLMHRIIRDVYSKEFEEISVAGEAGYKEARNFMKMMMPSHVKRVKEYKDDTPLFIQHNIEKQIEAVHETTVQLKSGGYLVINPTEALVSIDVNSGRSTRERHIEETALKTNLEAAEEVARQMRLRDLAGLVVIDFIDMENRKNNRQVERAMQKALSKDRAKVQCGQISNFGLMELSRQRLRPSMTEKNFIECPHCHGKGIVRTVDGAALTILRAIENEGVQGATGKITVEAPSDVILFLLNFKRADLSTLEERYGLNIAFDMDDEMGASDYTLDVERSGNNKGRGGNKQKNNNNNNNNAKNARNNNKGNNNNNNQNQNQKKQNNDENKGNDNQSSHQNQDQQKDQKKAAKDDNKGGKKPSRGRGKKSDQDADNAKSDAKSDVKSQTQNDQDKADTGADDTPKKGRKAAAAKSNAKSKKDDAASKDTSDADDKPKKPARGRSKKADDDKASNENKSSDADADDKPKKGRKPAAAKSTSKSKKDQDKDDSEKVVALAQPEQKDKPAQAEERPAPEYNVISEADDDSKKKKGWWSRMLEK